MDFWEYWIWIGSIIMANVMDGCGSKVDLDKN